MPLLAQSNTLHLLLGTDIPGLNMSTDIFYCLVGHFCVKGFYHCYIFFVIQLRASHGRAETASNVQQPSSSTGEDQVEDTALDVSEVSSSSEAGSTPPKQTRPAVYQKPDQAVHQKPD